MDRIRASGFTVHLIESLRRQGRSPISMLRAVVELRKLLMEEAIEVVHAHNAATSYAAYVATRLVRRNIAAVHSVRGIELRPTYRWRNWIYRLYPVHMLAVSDFTRRELLKLGASAARIHVTYNGVDIDRFNANLISGYAVRREFQLEDRTLIGHIGAFSGWKGQEVLVRALARLTPRFPKVHVVFVGVGESLKDVKEEAQRLGVADHVTFAGFRTDVELFHAAFDIYTQPSTMGEMFPNAILEAMAMGKTWVGSDISGLSELTADGEAGWVLSPGDDAALAGAIETLLADAALRRHRGQRAQREVLDRFTIACVVNRIEHVYRLAGAPDSHARES